MCMPQSNMTFFPPMVNKIQLRPTSKIQIVNVYMHENKVDLSQEIYQTWLVQDRKSWGRDG